MYNLEKGQLTKDVMDVTRPNQKYSAPEFGMFSTAEDLRHYCQMMLDRGSWKGRRILSARLVDEMSRPQMHTQLPKYEAGLGYAIYTGKSAEMSYAVTDGSYGANGASGCVIWMDPSLQHLFNALLPWRFQRRKYGHECCIPRLENLTSKDTTDRS